MLYFHTWDSRSSSPSRSRAARQSSLKIFHGTVVVHEAHKPKLMVINRNDLYEFLGCIEFACWGINSFELMKWNDHLERKARKTFFCQQKIIYPSQKNIYIYFTRWFIKFSINKRATKFRICGKYERNLNIWYILNYIVLENDCIFWMKKQTGRKTCCKA